MNMAQKTAWFQLLTAASIALSFGSVIVLSRIIGMPKAWFGMCFMFLMILGQLIFRKKGEQNRVQFDERDFAIARNATTWGHSSFYGYIISFALIAYSLVGQGGLISVNILPIMAAGGFVVLLTVRSIVTLCAYVGTGKGDKL